MKLLALPAALAVTALALAPASGSAGSADSSAPPQCSDSMLKASYKATDAATGHFYGKIILKNISSKACKTGGYGGISYVGDENGTQIGAPADRTPGTEKTITLQPGDKVKSKITEVDAGVFSASLCKPTPVDGFRIYVPNATKSQYVPHPTTGCKNSAVHLISQKPYTS
jgi:hypothetical protein